MITIQDNEKLKLIRKLASASTASARGCSWPRARTWSRPPRRRAGRAEFVLRAGEDVEPELLDGVELARLGDAGDRRVPAALSEPAGDVCGLPARGRRPRQRRRDHPRRARALATARSCSGPTAPTRTGRRRCARAWGRSSRRPPARAAFERRFSGTDGRRSIATRGGAGAPTRARRPARVVSASARERTGLPDRVLRAADRPCDDPDRGRRARLAQRRDGGDRRALGAE